MKLRYYQEECVSNITNMKEGEHKIAYLPTGCHSKGTKILMYNGKFKNVEDVQVGDLVMGIDSTPRKVLELHNGKDDMYKVIQNKGEDFIVNKGHILSLLKTNERSKKSNRVYESTKGGKIVNISIEEYLNKSNNFKHLHKLYKSNGIEFNNINNNLPLDPYFLGILIGDGCLMHNCVMVTTMDKEIVDYIYYIADLYDLKVRKEDMENNKSSNYYITTKEGKKNSHKLKLILKEIGIYNHKCDNKFIPDIYKYSSKENRYKLLAGLMDTDGYLSDKTSFEYSTKSKQLKDDILFLARSLGYYCNSKGKIIKGNTYYVIRINGKCDLIPTRVERRKAEVRKINKNHLVSGFKLEYIGKDEYYGFTLDGDNLYMLEDFIITHNSGKTIIMSELVRRTEERVLIIVLSTELREQTIDKIKLVCGDDISIGSVQGNINETNKRIIVATRQTLNSCKKTDRISDMLSNGEFKYILIDETHQACNQIKTILDRINCKNSKVVGFTATPWNNDMKKIYDGFVYKKELFEMIQEGFLIEPRCYAVETGVDLSHVRTLGGEYIQKDLAEALDTNYRNELIVNTIKEYASNRNKIILFCVSIEHAQNLAECCNVNGLSANSIDSTTDKKEREKVLKEFSEGKFKVLVNVNILSIGFDEPSVDCVVLARSTKSKMLYVQQLGRGLRLSPKTHKKDCMIIDIVDNTNKFNLVNCKTIFDVNNGETPLEAQERIKQEDKLKKEKEELERQKYEEEQERLRLQEIELFNSTVYNIINNSTLAWFTTIINGKQVAILSSTINKHYVIRKEDDVFRCYLYINKQNYDYDFELIEENINLNDLQNSIESEAIKEGSSFISRSAKWKFDKCTDKQISASKGKLSKGDNKWKAHKFFVGRNIFYGFKNLKNIE